MIGRRAVLAYLLRVTLTAAFLFLAVLLITGAYVLLFPDEVTP